MCDGDCKDNTLEIQSLLKRLSVHGVLYYMK